MYCAKCGISSDKALLFDAISEKGIIQICKKCSIDEDLPIIKKPSFKVSEPPKPIIPKNLKVSMSNQSQRMYQRLSRMSGKELKEEKTEEEKKRLNKQELYLKQIADKNYVERLNKSPGDTSKFIENFHWVVMRARRMKHLTPEQFAKAIQEPESAIKMLEQGIPPNNDRLVKKVEDYLKIRILKEYPQIEQPEQIQLAKSENSEETGISFDSMASRNMTISDLLEIKKEKKKNGFFGFMRKKNKEESEENNVDLSEEDFNSSVFKE